MNNNDFVIDIGNQESVVHGNIESEENPIKANKRTGKDPYYELSTSQVTNFVLQAGKEKASRVFNIYGSLDLLRPYFDVKPKSIIHKLLYSFIPKMSPHQKLDSELYGPIMIVFTLIALLICEIKTSEHIISEGTIFGTSFSLSFGYWVSTSVLLTFLCFLFNVNINMIQLGTLIGYSLFGHCVIVLIGIFYHPTTHTVFYILMILIAGSSSLKMVFTVLPHIKELKHKLIIGLSLIILQMLFLLYLHFSFHKMIEEFELNSAI